MERTKGSIVCKDAHLLWVMVGLLREQELGWSTGEFTQRARAT